MTSQPPAVGNPPPGAALVDFSEKVLIDAYADAVKGGLAALNSAAEKVLTAAFSLATALAAVIGLVSPKDDPGPLAIGIPFAAFAAAALGALLALLFSVKPASRSTPEEVTQPIEIALMRKKRSVASAVALLTLGTGIAVWVVIRSYGPGVPSEAAQTTIVAVRPDTGRDAVSLACPSSHGSVTGTLALDSLEHDFVEMAVPEGECGSQPMTLRIPKDQVRIMRAPASEAG